MAVYENGYYRISYNNYTLNASTSTSVTLSTSKSGLNNQFWYYASNKLKSEKYPSYGIAGTTSVTMSSSPINVEINTYTTNKCYIKRTSDGKFLAISSGSLIWSTTKTYWTIERIYKQTGVPKYDPEYFSASSGMSDGTWSTYWTGYLKSFFSRLYGGSSTNVTDNNIGQCMYGAIYGAGPYKGKFHTGLDFYKGGTNTEVKCPFTGEYLGYNSNYGCVYVYDSFTRCTFVFMHMAINSTILGMSAGDQIAQGTVMGTESNQSQSTISQHLHIEVHSGKSIGFASIPANSYDTIESLLPYAVIYQVL